MTEFAKFATALRKIDPSCEGATVLRVLTTAEVVTVHTDRGNLVFTADGDCCSHSWFEHVNDEGVTRGLLTGWDADTGYDDISENSDDCVRQYFCTLYTTRGRLVLELRNSSNGYYGGSVVTTWEQPK